jgi:hypothetical protein
VLKLLTRLYDTDGGAVRVNGLDVKDLTLEVGGVLTHDGVCAVAHIVVPHSVLDDDDVCTINTVV